MDNSKPITRRSASLALSTAFTTSIFTGQVKGANDRVAVGFIGLGAMGSGNLGYSMKVPGLQPAALCDVYQPHLERAEAAARRGGYEIKGTDDFRKIIADKSIDAVCISTPDHWHPYMTVEACKAGKDVYVEKPAAVYVDEGVKMVEAARKYKRIVQAGTMQRSGGYFKKAAELVKSGILGNVTFVHTWQNRWGVTKATFPTFRYFWDYAGGAMTDWGVHLLDPVHQCFDEKMPTAISAMGHKLEVTDNRDTPDTMLATFDYPGFIASYESRTANPMPMFGQGAATSIHGTEATIIVNRSGCWLVPNAKSKVEAQTYEKDDVMRQMNVPHWENWLSCIKSREKPQSEIETCVRSSTTCILANLSMRFKTRLDWDEKNWTVKQAEVSLAF
ncbi:MAG: Gfo/Idh/MocA family oxidoreductase [Acidobacteria bacterium]|nr:Gfo/Idh/MocA family oxidoreductase [Acidobacteriota bacterium]